MDICMYMFICVCFDVQIFYLIRQIEFPICSSEDWEQRVLGGGQWHDKGWKHRRASSLMKSVPRVTRNMPNKADKTK